jgi:hypothetical protein
MSVRDGDLMAVKKSTRSNDFAVMYTHAAGKLVRSLPKVEGARDASYAKGRVYKIGDDGSYSGPESVGRQQL